MSAEPLSIAGHHAWRESITSTDPRFDEVDLALEKDDDFDPYAGDPPNRKSNKEIGKLLDLLDSIENSNSERGFL